MPHQRVSASWVVPCLAVVSSLWSHRALAILIYHVTNPFSSAIVIPLFETRAVLHTIVAVPSLNSAGASLDARTNSELAFEPRRQVIHLPVEGDPAI